MTSAARVPMHLKRLFDIAASLFGLILAAPVMLVIAAALKLESGGPVFYSCRRVGKGGEHFDMLKFRTMPEVADTIDCKLCPNGDVRVTRLGRFLRRTKLNELPQLINVLRGDMSAVGPRPEDPKFIRHYPEQWETVLSVRPGIVGPNQIINRNEEDLFPAGEDPERYYIDRILPEKLARDVEYARNNTLWGDAKLLVRGTYVTLFKALSVSAITSNIHVLRSAGVDAGLSALAYLAANYLRYEALPVQGYVIAGVLFALVFNPVLFAAAGLYRRDLKFFSVPDFLFTVKASAIAGAFLVLGYYLVFPGAGHSRAVFVLYPCLLAAFVSGRRLAQRLVIEKRERASNGAVSHKRAVIYGAGRLGVEALRRLRLDPAFEVVGFIDDAPEKKNDTVGGVKVLGTGLDLPFLKVLKDVDTAVLAFKPAGRNQLDVARRNCRQAGIDEVLIVPAGFTRDETPAFSGDSLRPFEFADMLGMDDVPISCPAGSLPLKGAAVAVIGAGDSLGEQICRELVSQRVAALIVVETSEHRLEKIGHLSESTDGAEVSFEALVVPESAHRLLRQELSIRNPEWVIYIQPASTYFCPAITGPDRAALRFLATAPYVAAATQVNSDRFSFVSPHDKASWSSEDQEMSLLMEDFVSFLFRQSKTATKWAIVRVSNVLENNEEIFLRACNRISSGAAMEIPGRPLRFVTARNAARSIINSYPLHKNGEIFVERAGISSDLGTVIETFSRFQDRRGLTQSLAGHAKGPTEFALEAPSHSDMAQTGVPGLFQQRSREASDTEITKRFLDKCSRYKGIIDSNGSHTLSDYFTAIRKRIDERGGSGAMVEGCTVRRRH